METCHYILKSLGDHALSHSFNYKGSDLPQGIAFLAEGDQPHEDYLHITTMEMLEQFAQNPGKLRKCYVFVVDGVEGQCKLPALDSVSCYLTDLDWRRLYNLLESTLSRMKANPSVRTADGKDFADFIHDVVCMNITRADEILTRLRRFPRVNDGSYRVLTFEFDDPAAPNEQYVRLMNAVQKTFLYSNSTRYFGRIVTLAQSVSKEDDRVLMPKKRKDVLEAICTEFRCCCGASNTTINWTALRTDYIHACSTLKLGRAMRTDPEKRLFFSEETLTYRMLDVYYSDFKREFRHDSYIYVMHPGIGAVIRYDNAHGSNLRQLLHSFLRNERSYTKTAAEMHMHRNTVIYKVKKAVELIEDDLDDPDIRMRIQLSCMMCDYAERALGIPPTSFPGYQR